METSQRMNEEKQYACPGCSSLKCKKFEEFSGFTLFLCLNCDLVYSFPMRAMQSEEYSEMYKKTDYHSGFATALSTGQEYFFKKNKAQKNKNKILDIGTSSGLFLHEALQKGFDAVGLETDKKAISFGKEIFPEITIYNEYLDMFISRGKKFNFVTLFEVLEHVEDPKKILENAKKLLFPGGKLFVFVPNRNRTPKLYKEMIERNVDLPPHHLTKWSKKSLFQILLSLGFNKIQVRDIGKYHFSFLPSFGIASRVREGIVVTQKESGVNVSSKKYRENLKKIFALFARTRFILDKILFFWVDLYWFFRGYETDGLCIEVELDL